LDSTPSGSDGKKSIIKSKVLQSQSRNMAILVFRFSTIS
jgi:hypothetical protein